MAAGSRLTALKTDLSPLTKLWRSGVILSCAGLLAGLGNYAFQAIIGRCLDKAEFGYVNSTLGFIGLLGLPLGIASAAVTHYIAHFRATGDEARLQGLLPAAARCSSGSRWPAR
jgi:O-antigen/teichoic acid export membrane protein